MITHNSKGSQGGHYAQLKVRIAITKEIGENGFGEITNDTCLPAVIWWDGGGEGLLGGSQKATALGVGLGRVQAFPQY